MAIGVRSYLADNGCKAHTGQFLTKQASKPKFYKMTKDTNPVSLLRAELARRNLDGFIVPRADAHQGEYVPPYAARLGWVTGFTGSAGIAVILRDKAAIFVDGRYTLQVRDQVDTTIISPHSVIDEPPEQWIAANLSAGQKLGFDPWLHTLDGTERIEKVCQKAGAELVACPTNPIDTVWHDQPAPPTAPIVPHPIRYAGEASSAKRARVAHEIKQLGADAAILTLPDSIAWLLNIRGGDVAHSPLPLCFAILHADATVQLFAVPAKISDALQEHLGDAVSIAPPRALDAALTRLGQQQATILIDRATAAVRIARQLEQAGAQLQFRPDPCLLPKALKNDVEITGMRAAHLRDGAALSNFLAWLDREAPNGKLDELTAAETLQRFREATGELKDLSFPTISGAGPNGAIVHYAVTEKTNRLLEPGSLYLVDSGGQYLDGTTDVTRTVAIGTPTQEQITRFTQVLKGHIALSGIRFPKGVSGAHLDVLARQFLWKAGLDFDHGTGHGVGSYLSVHEGPQNISRRPNNVALQPGMIVSNEPGYYKAGEFGIRIENLVLVTAARTPQGGEREMMGFEPLTLAPIDLRLVDLALLNRDEREWLNSYHATVREKLTPVVASQTRQWLDSATRAL